MNRIAAVIAGPRIGDGKDFTAGQVIAADGNGCIGNGCRARHRKLSIGTGTGFRNNQPTAGLAVIAGDGARIVKLNGSAAVTDRIGTGADVVIQHQIAGYNTDIGRAINGTRIGHGVTG